jgi:hypothetical protein
LPRNLAGKPIIKRFIVIILCPCNQIQEYYLQLCYHRFLLRVFQLEVVPKLRRLVASFPQRRIVFEPKSGHVGFVVDKVALGHVFSEYFGFPCQFSFRRLLHVLHLSSGAGIIGQLVADVPLNPVSPQTKKQKKKLPPIYFPLSSKNSTLYTLRPRDCQSVK